MNITIREKKFIAPVVSIISLFLLVIFSSPMVMAAEDKYATAAELGLMQGFPPPADKQVTKANALQTPPFNRWSYQHMRMFYPTANIPAADKAVPLSKTIDWSLEEGLKVMEPGTGKTKSMTDFLKETWTDAIVVIRGDQIVYEKYLNSMTPNTPHQMMSATKSFGGLLGLMAVANGKLKESDPVTKYVPELKTKDGAFAKATFGQVLNMTNSMDFTEVYDDSKHNQRRETHANKIIQPVFNHLLASIDTVCGFR